MQETTISYDTIREKCTEIFLKKMSDYGTAWRILRPSSITDQIFIKAQRIRTLEVKGESKVNEGIEPEYIGIINYCIMGIIQLKLGMDMNAIHDEERVGKLYRELFEETKQLMEAKNHDYGEAWRDMRVSSLTDLILMKIMRVKQIEDNAGETLISEGIDANYMDMINYSVFALIRLEENC